MPQLDTSSWFMMILTMIFTLFIIMQLKISSHKMFIKPESEDYIFSSSSKPWEHKWTKIYLPLLLSLH
uniref:ATP synthase complex subunit 8 n=1 Tax=Hemiechinus auritus TaxID=217708 RepID=Q7Y8G4_HEMAU|nr:ATP synthase F0 subunit 8 [Hemiechinus auritus]BAC78852.1 ATPase subunit 8 [Hemiechinus auritus]